MQWDILRNLVCAGGRRGRELTTGEEEQTTPGRASEGLGKERIPGRNKGHLPGCDHQPFVLGKIQEVESGTVDRFVGGSRAYSLLIAFISIV